MSAIYFRKLHPADPPPRNPSNLESDLDEEKGKGYEQEPSHGGADHFCAQAS